MPLVSLMLFLPRYGGKGLHCICLSALLPVLFAWSGFAQSSTVTTYAGPPSPVPGAQATTQVFCESGSVCPDGGGWATQIVLVNPGDSVLAGTVQFLDQAGQAANTSHAYSMPARMSWKLQTSGTTGSILAGSVRVFPAANTAAPSGVAIFSFRNGGTTVTEAGVSAVPGGTAFRLYAEVSDAESIQTGLAVTNTSTSAAAVTLELNRLNGLSTGLTGTLSLPANGQAAMFLNQIQGFATLPRPFQGVLRVSSPVPVFVVGLRGRSNERNDFLITTTPPVNEATPPSTARLVFPHIADGGGYTTQIILFSGRPGQSTSGKLQLLSQSGGVLDLTLR